MTRTELEHHARTQGVTLHAACYRAGVTPKQPSRWRHEGVEPRQSTLRRLWAAVDEIARERADRAEEDKR